MKCIVKGCTNRGTEGSFVGNLCQPCYTYLQSGVVGPTDSFLGRLNVHIEDFTQRLKTAERARDNPIDRDHERFQSGYCRAMYTVLQELEDD